MGKKTIGLQANVNYHNVAMGQGQDVVAMAKLDMGIKKMVVFPQDQKTKK
jgi:hypothetical protein